MQWQHNYVSDIILGESSKYLVTACFLPVSENLYHYAAILLVLD